MTQDQLVTGINWVFKILQINSHMHRELICLTIKGLKSNNKAKDCDNEKVVSKEMSFCLML